jgi:hypothetical protein
MLELDGDFEKIKSEMKAARKAVIDASAAIRKKYRGKNIPKNEQASLEDNADHERLYSLSRVLPVSVQGVVINYKLYKAFMKKLKGFQTRIVVAGDGIVVQYWKPGSQGRGRLKLYDISSYFTDFEHIPIANIREDT